MHWHLRCGRAGSALLVFGADLVPGIRTVGYCVGRAWDVSSGPGLMEGEENEKRKKSVSVSVSVSVSGLVSVSLSLTYNGRMRGGSKRNARGRDPEGE